MYIRRLEQFKPTKENIDELKEVFVAVGYVYLLKRAEYENAIAEEQPTNKGHASEKGATDGQV